MPRARGDTRSEIRRVAAELFAAQGFEKTSLREVAERLGITKAALYYHYPSKAELARGIVPTWSSRTTPHEVGRMLGQDGVSPLPQTTDRFADRPH